MKKELTIKAPTVDEAVQKAAAELGVSADLCQVEVLEPPRKSLFGKLKEALVKVTAVLPDEEEAAAPVQAAEESEAEEEKAEPAAGGVDKLAAAKEYLSGILNAMGLSSIEMKVSENADGAVITFEGDGMAVLIGHHGETLDALQYLVALTCNRMDGEYYRITLDCGSYREKRESTLQSLAARIAAKVKKTGRSQLLEPMNPYERRIIHAVVSEIDGVTSKSKGEEPNRRVVIMSETPVKANTFNKNNNRRDDFRPKKPYPQKRERTMEEILKSDLDKKSFTEKEQSAELYSKIEL